MKIIIRCLLLAALVSAGCVQFPTTKTAGNSAPAVPPAAPPKQVTPEQVTPANADQMGDALLLEMDWADADQP